MQHFFAYLSAHNALCGVSRLMALLLVALLPLLTPPDAQAEYRKPQVSAMPTLTGMIRQALPLGEKPFILHSFASWCGVCGHELRHLAETIQMIPLPFYGLSWQDLPADSARFLQRYDNPFVEVFSDSDGLHTRSLNLTGTPETLLFNSKGELIWHYAGPLDAAIIRDELLPVIRKM